jgi:serine/threonine protein kinase
MGACCSTSDAPVRPHRQGRDRYKIGEELGKGHFAEVRACIDVETGMKFAIKIMDKKDLVKSEQTVRDEIAILKQVGHHKHIVALEDTFEDEKHFYLVMELCEGGDLFSKIVAEGKYSERRAARCCRQLADALQWIHKRGVTHRDLKVTRLSRTRLPHMSAARVTDSSLSVCVV